jgi:LysM domain
MNIRMALLLTVLSLFLALPMIVFGAEDDTVYVIKKGDTLWGISDRFVKDPKYWPNMWSKNSQITNPHLIYPGQKVRLVDGKLEIVDQPLDASAAKAAAKQPAAEPLPEVVAERTVIARGNEGRLAEGALVPLGRIIAGQHGRLILGEDDNAFTDIGYAQGGQEGQRYTIVRRGNVISHPDTNLILGTKIYPLGHIQLTKVEKNTSRAIIIRSFKETEPGDLLMPYKETKRREVTLKAPSKEFNGRIVETYAGTQSIAAGDVVYLDLGRTSGVEVGNLLYLVRDVSIEKLMVDKVIEKLPREVLGALVVVDVGEKTSTALIVKSIDAIFKTDRVVSTPQ